MPSARRLSNAVLLFLVTVVGLTTASGCAAPRATPFEHTRMGRVYCIRGFLDVFSQGMDSLAEGLRNEGLDARAMSGPAWRAAARQIESDFTSGDEQEPLILVGHSYGADHAVDVAKYLQQRDMKVRLLVLLDATSPPPIPANVERCLHLYKPTLAGDLLPFVFAGNPVVLDRDNQTTELLNEVVSTEALGPKAAAVNHLNIDKHKIVQEFVVMKIMEECSLRDSTPEISNSYRQGPPTPTLEASRAPR